MFIQSKRLRMAAVIAGSVLAGGVMGGTAVAFQSHMFNALHALQVARNQLNMALPDKGGYRLQAMSLVDQAISATNAGISAGAQ